ncbi:MAG: CpaF family protein [Chlorobiaceae bacterium]|nr:CpaF family protein [Chlorobiaceae bacterium]
MATLKDQIARWNRSTKRNGTSPESMPATAEATGQPAVVEAQAAPAPAPAPAKKESTSAGIDYYATKTKLHQKLLTRIDLNSIESLTPEQLRNELGALLVALIEEDALPLNNQERNKLVTDLQNEIMGLGPLEPLMADPTISEIMVNGYQNVYVEKKGCIQLSNIRFSDDAHLMKIIDKIVSRVGRRIDESTPMADARLPDGSRVNAIIPPLALDGPALTIRRFAVVPLQMHDLIEKNALTPAMAELLSALVKVKCNMIISGGTGSGKTTLLNILSGYIPTNERIVTIEDTAELQLQQDHVIRLETRPPNIEGKGEITMRALVKNSLRMRPDRIVLGEVRSSEVIDMLQAMNTGHDGSLTTIHANTPRDALGRLENLVGLGGINLPSKALRQLIASSVQFIIQATRLNDGSRKITHIQEIIGMEGDIITTQEIFYFERTGTNQDGSVQGRFRATGIRPRVSEKIRTYGISLNSGMFDPDAND